MFRITRLTKVIQQIRFTAIGKTSSDTISSRQNKTFCTDGNKEPFEPLDFSELKFPSKVPVEPQVSAINLVEIDRIEIDEETIQLLERLSLVNVDSK